tara:strand:- start:1997 stop:2980 length:984 start_codon:yes stop_codon:yes gene_type:complete
MSIVMGNKKYLATNEAAEITEYTIDYIGQLCREKKVACKRVSGHWFVREESLTAYSNNEENAAVVVSNEIGEDSGMLLDGVEYIATAKAAELTGYTQDYIGQLSRSGEIQAQKVGRRWFVGREDILQHKESHEVTDVKEDETTDEDTTVVAAETITPKVAEKRVKINDINFNVKYTSETSTPLIPKMNSHRSAHTQYESHEINTPKFETETIHAPISESPAFSLKTPSTIRTVKKPLNRVSRKDVIERSHMIMSTKRVSKPPKKKKKIAVKAFIGIFIASAVGYGIYVSDLDKVTIKTPALVEQLLLLVERFDTALPGNEFIYTAPK